MGWQEQGPALLVAVNAKFSHTNLAVRYLRHALEAAGIPAKIAEYTINQPQREILADIVRQSPGCVLFSCYIWNITLIRQLGEDLRLLYPQMPILLGGPEVSFDAQELLAGMPWASGILCGEGEGVIAAALSAEDVRGVWPGGGFPGGPGFVDLDALPFPYDDLDRLQNRVIYYEASRGCPYGCAYCLSSADRVVRRRSLPLVFGDLQRLLDARVMQVKFVDRTFNLDAARAYAIWEYLIAHDNGKTCFQMELGGDLTTPAQLELLRQARPGLFQFEVGVQSTCPQALAAAARPTDFAALQKNVQAVKRMGNIHQHLDLIAGLPGEGFERFAQSYDAVFCLRPEQLQLGFLKLLRGSRLYGQREKYRLVHSPRPPYEVLQTGEISFLELIRLKIVEEMTEVYYNSGRFSRLLDYLLGFCDSPFRLFLQLGESMPAGKIGKYEYYDRLFLYGLSLGGQKERMAWLMRYDLCRHERPRRLPAHCAPPLENSRQLLSHYKAQGDSYLELFPFDVTGEGDTPSLTAIRFDYAHRDAAGHAAIEKILLK